MDTSETTKGKIAGDQRINIDDFEGNTADSEEFRNGPDDRDREQEQTTTDDGGFSFDEFDNDFDIEDINDNNTDGEDFDMTSDIFGDDEGEEEEDDDQIEDENDDELTFDDISDKEKPKEDDDEDLADLNKRLGTDFNSIEEMKKALGKEDKKEEVEQETVQYESDKKNFKIFKNISEYKNDEDLIREDRFLKAFNQKRDLNDKEVVEQLQEEIEDEIETMRSSGTFALNVDNLRSKYKGYAEALRSKVEGYENKIEEGKKQTSKELNEALTTSLSEVYNKHKENFYGANVSKELIHQAYKDIKSGKFFREVEQDQSSVVELYLMRALKKDILKNASNSTEDEIKKNVLNQYSRDSNRQTLSKAKKGRKNSSARQDEESLIARFVK